MLSEETELTDEAKEIRAAELYSEGSTFREIKDELGVSLSFSQELTRRGIARLMDEEKSDNHQIEENNPIQVEQSPNLMPPLNQMLRPEQSYILETSGIPRRVTLTPKCLMIYDLWVGNGFQGDLSDFLEDAVEFLYNSSRPRDRMTFNMGG